jgi:alpha-beta hydrolase superfamily lysophospholipase
MKTSFKNRDDKKLVVLIENTTGKNGLVFIAHGLAGNKEEAHIQSYANAFLSNDYKVIRWDATNTIGESEGSLFKATLSNYYNDFEDVVLWAEKQEWYQEPFVIVGHSLGSACNIIFTSKYPQKVKALAPTSAFISAQKYFEWLGKEVMGDWELKGYREEESKSRPGLIKKLNWKLAEDMKEYELLDKSKYITMPILLLSGEKDKITPPSIQYDFYNLIPSHKKEIHIIKGASHNLNSKEHLKEIEKIMTVWAKKQI